MNGQSPLSGATSSLSIEINREQPMNLHRVLPESCRTKIPADLVMENPAKGIVPKELRRSLISKTGIYSGNGKNSPRNSAIITMARIR